MYYSPQPIVDAMLRKSPALLENKLKHAEIEGTKEYKILSELNTKCC
jgi:hypothetical protein